MNLKYLAALVAVFAVGAGSAYAGPTVKKLITGQDIKDGSIGLVDLSSSAKTSLKGQKGPKGDTGATGDTGPAGPQGAKGDTGAAGPTGPQGPTGPKGDTGAQGPAGVRGVNWRGAWSGSAVYSLNDVVQRNGSSYIATAPNVGTDPSSTAGSWDILVANIGPQGPAGPAGPAGAAGPAGPQGTKGDTGAAGPQGAKGDTGATGPAGSQGAKGDAGAVGPQGPKGDTGAVGPAGPAGPQGPKGDAGPTGSQGPPGITGYQLVTDDLIDIESTDSRVDTIACPPGKKALTGGMVPTNGSLNEALQMWWSAPNGLDGDGNDTWAVGWSPNVTPVSVEIRVACATING